MDEIREWIEKNPLRKYRTEQGIKQFHVAAKIGVGINTIRNWETGANDPRGENWQKISWLLGVDDAKKLWKEWRDEFPDKVGR